MTDEPKDKVDKPLEKKGGYPGAKPGDDKAPQAPPPSSPKEPADESAKD